MATTSSTGRYVGAWPKIGIRPTIDGRLGGVRPSPGATDLTVTFSLPDASAARLEAYDLAGRGEASAKSMAAAIRLAAQLGSNLRGDRGEFFTPRNICRMAVAMLDPNEKQLVLDPACGTGGFLITAMNHVIEKIRARHPSPRALSSMTLAPRSWIAFIATFFFFLSQSGSFLSVRKIATDRFTLKAGKSHPSIS